MDFGREVGMSGLRPVGGGVPEYTLWSRRVLSGSLKYKKQLSDLEGSAHDSGGLD